MKIAFVGKGGSGKTTLTALTAKYIASKGLAILAIDADINQHLAETLGMPKEEAEAVPTLGINIDRIKEYLRGSNRRIRSNASMIKTTPPGFGSRFFRLDKSNSISKYFEGNIDGVRIMSAGELTEEDLGTKCYHSKIGAVEMILNHLADQEKEYVIVDMTAGADSFASGIFTKFDLTILVVEPTIKSISVYEQYKKYAKDYCLNIKVVANKVMDESDIDFIREKTGDDLVAVLRHSHYIRSAEKGGDNPISELEPENLVAIKLILSEIEQSKKDWKRFYRQAVEFHLKNAVSWASASVGEDLSAQIDPDFDIEKAMS